MIRPTKKLTSLLPLLAMAALAGITYWLLQATLPPKQTPERPKEHAPDYFQRALERDGNSNWSGGSFGGGTQSGRSR